jgi:hypothetical protein
LFRVETLQQYLDKLEIESIYDEESNNEYGRPGKVNK